MIKSNKMIGVGVLLLAILMAGAVLTIATSVTNNDAPAANVGPGADVEIMNFTIEDGGDLIINDTTDGLSPGANLTNDFANVTLGYDSDWTNVSSYDATDGDGWNASVDFLYINNSGTAAFNNSTGTDYVIGGDYSVMGSAIDDSSKMTYGGFDNDWPFTSLDNTDGDGDFDVTNDAIIIDGDENDFYQDNFTEISIVSDSDDNPIVSDVVSSMTIYGDSGTTITTSSSPFVGSLTQDITQNETYTVNMTLSDSSGEWDEDYYNMLANATLTLASGDETVVNGNTIKASHVYLDSEYYDEDVTITITLEDDALNDDPNRIQEKTVQLTSTSDVKTLDITLVETGADTGIFTADVITSSGTVSGNELHAEDGDTITVTNGDFTDTATVDSSAPSAVEVTSPDSLQYKKSTDTLDVDYGYTEANPYQTTIQFVNSDGDVDAEFVKDDASEDPDAVTLDLSNPDEGSFEEGLYSIKLSVEDAAGNVNNTEILQADVLMIDDTGPSVNESTIANNITGTENYYNGYYNNSFAFNLTFDLEDNGEIDNDTVVLHYNNSTSEGTITPVNVTTVSSSLIFPPSCSCHY
ncbi:autotransporter outer membrane beta-barrel domain-containing protein [Methanohalophilus profundi]|uniref:hypothetical protein n=1 Tax=Methanohalophilus profundi TaxID=2138083 RepID=UPI00101DB054|nr:hypothetical protein [Methanohalophilus profundi]